MKKAIRKGAVDQTVNIYIVDTSGDPLEDLVYNTASLKCYYVRERGAPVAITLVDQTVTGAHTDGGFKEIDSAGNMPGWYRLDLPDACFATGANSVGVHLMGATGMKELTLEIQLDFYESLVAEFFGTGKTSYTAAGTFGELFNDVVDAVVTDGVAISTTVMDDIAERLMIYDIGNVEDTAPLDSLAGEYLGKFYFLVSSGELIIFKTDGVTEFARKTITSSAVYSPIIGIS